ncbi:unnamed protein product [Plutella xylostella]|uniref:(diamondback moth) hypothetical protein n=1 Tax=Plutella xylostella TaxID=51655 RepID=A0A8S4G2N5_PLUXY|nr:unnamed protein product [Plutella xylostella]
MGWSQNWHEWLVVLGLALSAWPIGCSDYSAIAETFGAEAVARCNEKCPFQNRTGVSHFDLTCGYDCSMQQCTLGCSLWKRGLETSCQASCNVTSETVVSRELYCVMGCNEALNSYYQKLRELIGTPQQPALVADSLTPNSLSLVWEAYGASANLRNLTFLVQWRYEELPGSWQYSSNDSLVDRSIINVWNLRPYTKYRFRVAIFLSGRSGSGEPIYSAPSVVISTLESGKPASPPAALRAAAPDPSRVAISWEPGPFANGPLIGFVLRLVDTQPNVYAALKELSASNNTFFYMFQNLQPSREYEVSVAMRNAEGEGPRAYMTVATPPLPTTIPQQPVLILGSERNVLAAPANDMLSDPVELYSTEHKITGVGLDISSDYLFVSVSNGYVYRSTLSRKSQSVAILTPDSKYKPLDLSVDWLNRHLYVLGEVYYNKVDSSSEATVFPNWEILRCDFDGKNLMVALSGFSSRPIHFEVDPYNGYLFWALRGVERGGLYRLELAQVSNGAAPGATTLIVRDAHLGAFTADHADFRLLVAHLRRNNVLAVSLDGREITDFRSNTQTPMFTAARSIAYANGLFYWTNGNEMLTEEYHAQSDSYFHNEYPLVYNMTKIVPRQVLVNLRSCQPIPVPVNPPISVQAVLDVTSGAVTWAAPLLLGHQGRAAWRRWRYHLHLTDSRHELHIKDINGTSIKVDNLKENTEYVVRVAAVTESGSGPWSTEFIGRTLEATPSTLQSKLILYGSDGLLQTNLVGEDLKTLIHRDQLKNLDITDIASYSDKLYLVTNESTVMWYNTTTNERGYMENMDDVGGVAVDWVGQRIYWSNPKQQLVSSLDIAFRTIAPYYKSLKRFALGWPTYIFSWLYLVTNESTVMWYNTTTNERGYMENMDDVGGVAVDWVGQRIYWSNPKQQLITRGNLDGSNREPVPIVTVCKELSIDSMGAALYWSTGHAVEAARLSGDNRTVYYPARLFQGKHLMGLTLDLQNRWVYWLVRGYDGSELHRAPTQELLKHHRTYDTLLTRLPGTSRLGPLRYVAGRLLWVTHSRVATADALGRYSALLPPAAAVCAVRDPTTPRHLIAIPDAVPASSIKVEGQWNNFTVRWAPTTNVNVDNCRINYHVSVTYGSLHIEKTVDAPYLTINTSQIPAYSEISLGVRATSPWGGGGAALASRRSPQAAPPAPEAPRVYTTTNSQIPAYSEISLGVRATSPWGGGGAALAVCRSPQAAQPAPEAPRVYTTTNSDGTHSAIFRWKPPARPNGVIREYSVRCRGAPCDARLSPAATRHTHNRLPPNTTIYFQVRAATDAGYGPYSYVVQAYSNDVNPIPKVMISTQESIKIIDLDSGDSETVPKSTGIPVDLAVSIEENIVYWVNNLDEIFSSRINGSGHSKVTSINGTLLSMCYDWASRAVYWAARAGGRHAVYSRQLTNGAPRPRRRVLDAARPAAPLLCHPSSALYWYEESSNLGLGTLMTAHTDGTHIRPFFNTTRHAACNCPENPQVGKSFVIDMTNDTDELYWIDPWTNQIIASDMRACKCRVVVDGTEKKKYGFIPISIAVDSKYIYWFNATERMIYYTTKNRKSKIEQVKATYGYKIAALDPRTQPYPPRHCLYPWSNDLTPKMVSNSANSIALRLPDVGKPEQCRDRQYDMTASEYTVYYRLKSEDDGSACNKAVCKFIDTVDKEVEIGELLPFTNYSVSVEVTNYYAKLHEEKPTVGPAMTLQTAAEAPSPATDVTATVLSPVLARVEWTPEPGLWYELHWRTDHLPVLNNKYKVQRLVYSRVPATDVTATVLSPEWTPEPGLWYELHWRTDHLPVLNNKYKVQRLVYSRVPATDVTATVLSPEWTPEPGLWYKLHWRTDHLPVLNNKYKEHNTFEVTEGRAANMTRLSPNTVYTVWIRARSNHSAVTVDSQSLRVKTYPLPTAIGLINATAYSATVAWHPPSGYTLYHYKVEYTEASSQQWLPCTKRAGGEWLASGLEPKTRYRFRLRLQYVASAPPYLWPHDDRYTFETLGDVPGAPGRVQAAAVGERVARLWWREPPPRGAPVDHYRLWGRQQTRYHTVHTGHVPGAGAAMVARAAPARRPRGPLPPVGAPTDQVPHCAHRPRAGGGRGCGGASRPRAAPPWITTACGGANRPGTTLCTQATCRGRARLWWREPPPRGAPVDHYRLWGRQQTRYHTVHTGHVPGAGAAVVARAAPARRPRGPLPPVGAPTDQVPHCAHRPRAGGGRGCGGASRPRAAPPWTTTACGGANRPGTTLCTQATCRGRVRLWWREPPPRGAPVDHYRLWGRQQTRYHTVHTGHVPGAGAAVVARAAPARRPREPLPPVGAPTDQVPHCAHRPRAGGGRGCGGASRPRAAPPWTTTACGGANRLVVNANSSNNLSALPPDLPSDLRDDLKKRILEEGLELLHNGTDSYWLIGEGELLSRYWVYVEAHNEHGWSALSERGDVEVWAGGAGGAGALKAALMALAAAALALPPLYCESSVLEPSVLWCYHKKVKHCLTSV